MTTAKMVITQNAYSNACSNKNYITGINMGNSISSGTKMVLDIVRVSPSEPAH